MMVFSIVPFLLGVYVLELVVEVVELWTNPLDFFEDELESLEDGVEFMLPEHYYLLVFHLLFFLACIPLLIIFMPFALVLLIFLLVLIVILVIFLLDGLRRRDRARLVDCHWWRLLCLHVRWYRLCLLPLHSHLLAGELRMWLRVDGICLMRLVLCFYRYLLVVRLLGSIWVHHGLHIHLRRTANIHAHRLHSRIKRWITSHKI